MSIVFSLGGSIFLDKALVKKYADYFEQLAKTQQVGVLVGGGKKAREAIQRVKQKTANEVIQHLFGIAATRENAQEFIKLLKNSNKTPALDYEQAFDFSAKHKIIVMGGTIPYLTTDSNTVILAELLEADKIINLTNVDYLYDKDPNKFKNAKRIEKISKDMFMHYVLQHDKRRPGEHFVIDTIAAFILEKTRASLYIINGKDLNSVKNAVNGNKFIGTVIQ